MLQLRIENCNTENAEKIAEFLEISGALSVSMLDQHDYPILEPELGTMPLWPNIVIEALFDADFKLDCIKHSLNLEYNSLKYFQEILPTKDWGKACLDNFKAMQLGDKLLISPSWLVPTIEDSMPVLVLDPGLAFGTGAHETTNLCLTWLANADLIDKSIIDYGCGSGILGLSALKLGAKHVYAIDIDEQALIATKSNAVINNIFADKITISKPDFLEVEFSKRSSVISDLDCKLPSNYNPKVAQNTKLAAELFSITALEPVDLIFANILLKTLISLKNDFISFLKKAGKLVVSGILIDQVYNLVNEFNPELRLIAKDNIGEWAMLVFEKY